MSIPLRSDWSCISCGKAASNQEMDDCRCDCGGKCFIQKQGWINERKQSDTLKIYEEMYPTEAETLAAETARKENGL